MATQNAETQLITDLDASPVVKHGALEVAGTVRESIAVLTLTSTQADGDSGSVWRFLRLPARARVSYLGVANEDLDGATPALAVDIGLHEIDGGAAKDADFFASAVTTLQSENVDFQDLTHESAVIDHANYGKQLWEQLGDTDTPENRNKEYDVTLSVTTAAGANPQGGDIVVKVQYVLLD